jgi:hypothetical protein
MSFSNDVEILRKTLERAERAVVAQKRHIATMPDSHWKLLAQKNLAGLEEMQERARKTHARLRQGSHSLGDERKPAIIGDGQA